jgi:2'-5' RNA ligase
MSPIMPTNVEAQPVPRPLNESGPTDLYAMIFPDRYASVDIHKTGQFLCETRGLVGRPLDLKRSHLTVLHVGSYWGMPAADEIQKVQIECLRIASGTSPFEVRLDEVMSFSNSRETKPLVMCTERRNRALVQLHQELSLAITGWDTSPIFKPHVTMLYDKKCVEKTSVEPVIWTAKEIVLVLSYTGQTFYQNLGSFLFNG